MKKCKGLTATMLVAMVLLGSVTFTWGNISINQGNTFNDGGGFTTMQDPNPKNN